MVDSAIVSRYEACVGGRTFSPPRQRADEEEAAEWVVQRVAVLFCE